MLPNRRRSSTPSTSRNRIGRSILLVIAHPLPVAPSLRMVGCGIYYGHRMLSVHRHGPLEANLREPRENVAVADEATDFLFQGLPLIDDGVEIPIVAVALQSLQEIHGKPAELALLFIGNHVNVIIIR